MSTKISKFGEEQLAKFGWKQGKGLGKNEDGIATYLRVKQKKDNSGLGADSNSAIKGLWWDRLYNNIASKFSVPAAPDDSNSAAPPASSSSPTIASDASDPYEASSPRVAFSSSPVQGTSAGAAVQRGRPSEASTLVFGLFIKSGVQHSSLDLVGTGQKPLGPPSDSVQDADEDDDEVAATTNVSDAALLAACEGRTCRQNFGARGKLSRVQAQEESYARQRATDSPAPPPLSVSPAISLGATESETDSQEECPLLAPSDAASRGTKGKKRRQAEDPDLATTKKKKKKKIETATDDDADADQRHAGLGFGGSGSGADSVNAHGTAGLGVSAENSIGADEAETHAGLGFHGDDGSNAADAATSLPLATTSERRKTNKKQRKSRGEESAGDDVQLHAGLGYRRDSSDSGSVDGAARAARPARAGLGFAGAYLDTKKKRKNQKRS